MCYSLNGEIYIQPVNSAPSKVTIGIITDERYTEDKTEQFKDGATEMDVSPKGKEIATQTALPVRLFKMRMEKLKTAREQNSEIANSEKIELEKLINALPKNNVVVQDNATDLEKVYEPSFWEELNEDKIQFLDQTIAPILRALSSVDFKATSLSWIPFGICLFGLLYESVADMQKSKFKKINHDPNSFIQTGLFKFSRYPQYFGEMTFW